MIEYYKNNTNLPVQKSSIQFSQKELEELEKCMDDPIYFADNYFKVIHIDNGLIPMKLYTYQRDGIKILNDKNKLVMASARQIGKTAMLSVMILHHIIFKSYSNVAILANRKSAAKEVLERCKLAYEHLPRFLKPGIVAWNKESIELDNGSKIFADATSGNSCRGKSIDFLVIDEFGHIDNWDEFSTSVMPTVSSGKNAKMVFCGTPKGLNQLYYYLEAAKKGNNDFGWMEIPWYKVDGRDEEWKRKTLAELNFDQQKFEQEQCVAFLGSSGTLISGAALKLLSHQNPLVVNPHLYQYKEKEGNHQYVMTVDTSRGKGLDYSAFHVVDVSVEPHESVCVYHNNMVTPTDFADVCYQMATYYNNAFILVELNDLGSQVADILFDYEMDLIFTKTKGRLGKQVSYESDAEKGITTTHGSKSEGCSMLKLLIEQNKLVIHDKNTIDELKTFSSKGKGWEAESGKHDDLVMCLVLFGWLASAGFIDQLNDDSIMAKLRERTEEDLENDLLPFGIMIDGHDQFEEVIDASHDARLLNELFN